MAEEYRDTANAGRDRGKHGDRFARRNPAGGGSGRMLSGRRARHKEVSADERPGAGHVLSFTVLVLLAWLPLLPEIEPQVSAYIGFLVAVRLASLRWPALTPGRWLLLPLTLGGIASAFGTYHTFLGPAAGIALLGTMLSLKLLEMRRLRDIRFGTILYGFLLVSQFLLDESPLRVLYLVALLVLDVALMADLTARTGQGRRAMRSAVRKARALTLQALPLALVLFVLFPRLSAPLWSLPTQGQKSLTGMSDWMEPGSVGELVLSHEPAFRVRFDGPVPSPEKLFWRGPVAWHTDGQRWSGWSLDTPLAPARPLAAASEEVSYRVELEPSGRRWLFTLDLPISVPEDARILGDYQVVATKPIKDNQTYRVTSALRYDSGPLALSQELAGTQLPSNITDRMRALVAGWKQESSDPQALVYRALQHFNQEPFYYSLSPPMLGANPSDEFLFESRRGFCEHYADSFTLLMRLAGIPARVVLGYMGGELNPVGDYLMVRQSDAHAWVEVWLNGKGWVRVDPTAAIAPERIERSDLLDGLADGAPIRFRLDAVGTLHRWVHNLRLLVDAVETGWRTWVVGLSTERQQQMLEMLGLGYLREYGLVVALIVAVGVVLTILLLTLTRKVGPRDPLEKIYSIFCTRLARVGLPRHPTEGPQDFSRRVIAARPDLRPPVESFMALYLPQRYGTGNAATDRRALALRLQRFRPRRHRAPSAAKFARWRFLSTSRAE